MRSLQGALLLTLVLAGCKAPTFTLVGSTPPTVPASKLARPVRLGVIQQRAPALLRFRALVDALKQRKHQVVLLTSSDPRKQALDYVLEPKFRLIGRPCALLNFLVAWVFGPTFGAPGWAGLQYDYEVETQLTLTRPGVAKPLLDKALLRDTYDLAYTSNYYVGMIYGIDLGVLSGIQSMRDELDRPDELEPVEQGFLENEELKERYLRRVVNTIENAIAEAQRNSTPPAPPESSD